MSTAVAIAWRNLGILYHKRITAPRGLLCETFLGECPHIRVLIDSIISYYGGNCQPAFSFMNSDRELVDAHIRPYAIESIKESDDLPVRSSLAFDI